MSGRTRWALIVIVVVVLNFGGAVAYSAVLPADVAIPFSFLVGMALGCAGMLYGMSRSH